MSSLFKNRKGKFLPLLLMYCFAVAAFANTEKNVDLLNISLQELFEIKVSSASGIEESLKDAPATMLVITSTDIKQRGYTDLSELFIDLPGFDNIVTNGTDYLISYQRGYRTPFLQRTLFMINGVVDNTLWSHGAIITRQYPINIIERVEVLYGPAGAVYGPNAFSGIVNVITKDIVNKENNYADISLQIGSYDTQAIDIAVGTRIGQLNVNLGIKEFTSDEPGLDDYAPWGFTTLAWLQNDTVWGPINDLSYRNVAYSEYADRARNSGIIFDISYFDEAIGSIKLNYLDWTDREGYGPYYAFDRAKPNQGWNHSSKQIWIEHVKQLNSVNLKSILLERHSRIFGGWVEALPDWDPVSPEYSYVSISDWNTLSSSILFKQNYDYQLNDRWRFNGGIKFEWKTLTKAYDICGYWIDTLCTAYVDNGGLDGQGQGVIHSSRDEYVIQPTTLGTIPEFNLADTTDKGVFLQTVYDYENWRINAGIRYDNNSIYGSSFNPRSSLIYRIDDSQVIKVLYGEAFQEPSPLQLWGGWSGRQANPDLQPESAKNFEIVYKTQWGRFIHSLSVYHAEYDNVVKEEAENAGSRKVKGLEYHGRFTIDNFIDGADKLTGYLYYTYADSKSSVTYNHTTNAWEANNSELGDIAPHKLNFGVNWPLGDRINLNFRGNYVAERVLYSRNPLRLQGIKTDSYTVFDINVNYDFGVADLSLKVKNLFDKDYYQPGVESANSGNDFSQRSEGFHNSLIPQAGTSYLATLTWKF